MEIEWDRGKAASNFRKHRIAFKEAATALLDPMALARENNSSEVEPRWVIIGMSERFRLLTVVYTVRVAIESALSPPARPHVTEANHYA